MTYLNYKKTARRDVLLQHPRCIASVQEARTEPSHSDFDAAARKQANSVG